jgi:lysophospholipase L1-like esterase
MTVRSKFAINALFAATLVALPANVQAQDSIRRPDNAAGIGPACVIAPELAQFDFTLPRTGQRMAARQPVRIVAIGSSSTFGEGASSPEWTYPSRLRLELTQRFPAQTFQVLNRGVSGDTDYDKRDRFERDVIAERPDVVLWQLGTNSMLGGDLTDSHRQVLRDGITHLSTATGADIVLIDPQYAPKVIRGGSAHLIVGMIADVARDVRVNLFRRYEMMRRWREVERLSFDKFISEDELHMNDWSYACIARALAIAMAEAATRPQPERAGSSAR